MKKVKVVLYGTHICPWCQLAREFLRGRNVEFEDVYVDDNKRAAAVMIKKSGQHHVPVIEAGKKLIVGYDEDALKKLFRKK